MQATIIPPLDGPPLQVSALKINRNVGIEYFFYVIASAIARLSTRL